MFSLVLRISGRIMPIVALAWCMAGLAHGQAANVYVTQSGSSTGSCTATPRLSAAGFNLAANWGAGSSKIGPGTTVLVCGTLTTGLTFQSGGVAGKPITLKFDKGAVMSSPAWSWNTGAISNGGYSNLVIDGGTNGMIENTANGISKANKSQTTAVELNGGSNIEVENLTCANMFVMTAGSKWPSGLNNTHLNCIYDGGSSGNISIHNNVMHDVAWAIDFQGNSASGGVSIYDNEIYNFDHGFALGLDNCSPSCSASNVIFHDNHVHDTANWDDPSDSNHHDGVHIYDNAGGGTMRVSGVVIYNNLFDGSWGKDFTAQVFCQSGPGTIEDMVAYNNVFAMPNAVNAGNGLWNCSVSPSYTLSFYSNSLVGNSSQTQPQFPCFTNFGDSIDFRNNAFTNCPVPIANNNVKSVPRIVHWDHNVYEHTASYWGWGKTFSSFAAFQAACGCDLTGSNASNSAYATTMGLPMSGSPVLHTGIDMCGVLDCAGDFLSLTSDTSAGATRNPVVRPKGANAWDIGAYQVSNTSLPAAPVGLTATVQ